MSKIRFSSDILKRLGEELNPGIDKSILELVKNSYDADADNCTIDLHKNESTGTYTLCITDDGYGMSSEEINNGWLVLGHSQKNKEKTPKGRIPAGSKGLGRLAALRMGSSVSLETVSIKTLGTSYSLLIKWDEYDQEDLVDDVELEILEKENMNGFRGTKITIDGITQEFYWNDIKKLAKELILLSDPFGDTSSGFNPVFITEEYKEFSELVQRRYFNEARYHVIATLNNKNTYSVTVKDWKDQILFETNSLPSDSYNTVDLKFELWIFLLSSTNFTSKDINITDVRTWLKELGGISIYQNNIRVAPYGEEGNDWLDLNLQRAKSPEERPSTNTVIGRVIIDDKEELLYQKTDRSGFIENSAFFELKHFCCDVLDWVAKKRLEIAELKRKKERIENPKESEKRKAEFECILNSDTFDKDKAKTAFIEYEKATKREIASLQKDLLLYRTLSTAGIEAATFAHEMQGEHIKNIFSYLTLLQLKTQKNLTSPLCEELLEQISNIRNSITALNIPTKATLSLLKSDKRKIEKVNINKTIFEVVNTFSDFYKKRDTNVIVNEEKKPLFVWGTISSIECIIINLIANAITALESNTTDRKIVITIFSNDDKYVSFSVKDSGTGIKDLDSKEIWLPGKTTKDNGTGLGLTIVQDTVLDLGGNCSCNEKSDINGAEFIINLPALRN